MAPRLKKSLGLHELSGTPRIEHRIARTSKKLPSDVEAFLGFAFAGRHAIVDALSVLAFFGPHGLVAIPASFTADFFLGHYLTGLG